MAYCMYMVSLLNFKVTVKSGFETQLARSTCVVFFGKTLYSQSAFPHPEVKMGTCKLPGKPD